MQSRAKIVLVLLLFWVFAFVGYYAIRNSMDEDEAVANDIEEERNEKTNPTLKNTKTTPTHDSEISALKELSFEEFQQEMKDWQAWLRSNDASERARVRNMILRSVGIMVGQILVSNIAEALIFNVALKAWAKAGKSAGAAVGKTAGRLVMQSGTRLAASFASLGAKAAWCRGKVSCKSCPARSFRAYWVDITCHRTPFPRGRSDRRIPLQAGGQTRPVASSARLGQDGRNGQDQQNKRVRR